MNIPAIAPLQQWEIAHQANHFVRLVSPFTFGEDGACIAFTVVFPDSRHFVLTDHQEHLMMAEKMGAKCNKKKWLDLNHTHGVRMARFTEEGEITACGTTNILKTALNDALKLALSLSFKYPDWLPKVHSIRFRSLVEKTLLQHIPPERLLRDYPLQSLSGHEIIFPFAIRREKEQLYIIDTVALENNKLSWKNIYQTYGRFSDIKKNLNNPHFKRLAVMEEPAVPADNADWGSSLTLLADVANVKTLNDNWRI